MRFLIYKVRSKTSRRLYIGVTYRTVQKRWWEHLSEARCKKQSGDCRALNAAIRKYGKDGFTVRAIEAVGSVLAASRAERKWIKKLDTVRSGYNISYGGYTQAKLNEETKKLMSCAHKARWAKVTASERKAIGAKLSEIRLAWSPSQLNTWRKKFKASYTPKKRRAARRKALASTTHEQRSASARKAAAALTPKQRSDRVRLANSRRTPEELICIGKKISQSRTREQRAEASRKFQAAKTPEARSASARKRWVGVSKAERVKIGARLSESRDMKSIARKMRGNWKDPEKRAARIAAIRAGWVRRKKKLSGDIV